MGESWVTSGTEFPAGPPDDDEYHVVVVGRAGDHVGAMINVVGPGRKREAVATCERAFRKEHRLPSSVALVARVVFSGSEVGAADFTARLITGLDTEQQGSNNGVDNPGCNT